MFNVRLARLDVRLAPRLGLFLLVSLTAAPLLAAAAENPYEGIVVRNVFGLKPPPPPPDPESLKPPPSKITLTGIITIFAKKQAMMKSPPGPAAPAKPGQPPEPPKEHSYLMGEGERQDEITVLQIDEVAKTVKIDNSGHIETLTFSTNSGPATAAAPAAAPAPFGGGMPQPGAGFRTIPRPLRVPGMGGAAAPYGGNAMNSGVGADGQPALGGLGAGAATTPATQPTTDPQQPYVQRTLEENVALAEINAARNEQLRAAGARIPPLPHHPLAAGMYGDSSEAQAPPEAPAAPAPYLQRPGMPMPQ